MHMNLFTDNFDYCTRGCCVLSYILTFFFNVYLYDFGQMKSKLSLRVMNVLSFNAFIPTVSTKAHNSSLIKIKSAVQQFAVLFR